MKSTEASTDFKIERVTCTGDWPTVDAILKDYLPWVVEEMESVYGVRLEDSVWEMERHHAEFSHEALEMVQGKGFLLLSRLRDIPVAVVALKHVDAVTAEVKRLYVRPEVRGNGVGGSLMEQLVGDARQSGYKRLRLETMSFMTSAINIYSRLGFKTVEAFSGSQAEISGVVRIVRFMEMKL